MQYDQQTPLGILCADKFSVTPYSIFLLSCLTSENFSGKTICDFGCGTGVIGLNIIANYKCNMIGIDVVQSAVELSRQNAQKNGVEGAQFLTVEEFYTSPIYSSFDYIISNPASIPTPPTVEYNPFMDGGEEGDKMIVQMFQLANTFLKPDGQVLFLHTSLVSLQKTVQYLDKNGFMVSVENIKQMEFRSYYRSYEYYWDSLRNKGQSFFFENGGKRYELVYFLRLRRKNNCCIKEEIA
ncbi:MAG: methyltransferase [Pseudomonadota bacterium]